MEFYREILDHNIFVKLSLNIYFIILAFLFRKKGYINFVPKLVLRLSLTFLVNISPRKPLDVATWNFVAE